MASKGGNFLLDNIEKIILPIIGFICVWLLVSRVMLTPDAVEYDGRKFSPGGIDKYIEKQTDAIQIYLGQEPKPARFHQEVLSEYVSMLDEPLHIDANLWPAVPRRTGEYDDGRQYAVPEAPVISDAVAGRIRALAYLPKQQVGGEDSYNPGETEPNDLDMVTVEAKLDVSGLYSAFYDNFAGPSVKQQWRDPCLAKPVFAAVQLQRSEELADGGWSDWQVVGRLKNDDMSTMLEVIENVNDLPRGGMRVRLLQYNSFPVMVNLLQPRSYSIASAEEQWFPPSLHKRFVSLLKEQQATERREEMDKAKEERDKELEARRSRREGRTTTRESSSSSSRTESPTSMPMGRGADRTERPVRDREERDRQREELLQRREQEKETVDDVYAQLTQLRIRSESQLQESTEPLLFWSYDDTAEPGRTYRYRIRLGVFNPLAGSNKLESGSESYKDKVIIWSNFADAGTVEIPARLCFFAKDIRESTNTVIVEVFRYAMGYWYSKEYVVETGEVIGRIDEPAESKDSEQEPGLNVRGVLIPEKVDFRTEAMMVDAVATDDWTGGRNLRPRNYFDMYYSYDGSSIESTPIRQRFWSSDMQSLYNDIHSSMRLPKQPPRARESVLEGPGQRSAPSPVVDRGKPQPSEGGWTTKPAFRE